MYSLMRRVHSYSGLLLVLFVMMYFLTGIVVTEQDYLDMGGVDRTVTRAALEYTGPADVQAMGLFIQETFEMRGKRMPTRVLPDGGHQYFWTRPGVQTRVVVPPTADSVVITAEARSSLTTLSQLHRINGYGGGFLYDVWAFVFDLVSASMILFAATGIYLWYRRTPDRRLGWTLLAGSWGFTALVYAYLWFAP